MKFLNGTKIVFTFVLIVLSTNSAMAVDEIGQKTITSIGTQIVGSGTPSEQTIGYFRVAESWLLAPCAYGVMYFDPTTTMGKNVMASLLTAKVSGIKISRVVYSADLDGVGNTICSLAEGDYIVELE